jgi:hypothetical protein
MDAGCTSTFWSIQEHRVPVKRFKHGASEAQQEPSFQLLAARLTFFTLRRPRIPIRESVLLKKLSQCRMQQVA